MDPQPTQPFDYQPVDPSQTNVPSDADRKRKRKNIFLIASAAVVIVALIATVLALTVFKTDNTAKPPLVPGPKGLPGVTSQQAQPNPGNSGPSEPVTPGSNPGEPVSGSGDGSGSGNGDSEPASDWKPVSGPVTFEVNDLTVDLDSELEWLLKDNRLKQDGVPGEAMLWGFAAAEIDGQYETAAAALRGLADNATLNESAMSRLLEVDTFSWTQDDGTQKTYAVTDLVGPNDCIAAAEYYDASNDVNGVVALVIPECGGYGAVFIDAYSTRGNESESEDFLARALVPSVSLG